MYKSLLAMIFLDGLHSGLNPSLLASDQSVDSAIGSEASSHAGNNSHTSCYPHVVCNVWLFYLKCLYCVHH